LLWGNGIDEVTAIEYDQEIANAYKSAFPSDEVLVCDAHEFLLDNYRDYDFIWASPPCPSHSDIRRCGVHAGQYGAIYPDMGLYQEIILLQNFARTDTRWVVENVKPYYPPLIPPSHHLHRHLYWSNFHIDNFNVTDSRKHNDIVGSSTVYGFNITDTPIRNKRKVLRNMVDPELGNHIFNCALDSITEQGELF
jgi:DNA (cytosine-5)-methyltransferase 1